ncbi:XylR N-terminal domain-containing protein [Alicyclobacillus suci]|uniref:XylR N-terminal domain-containing protein n=1 Tax=Alicyclobacillus suci TaxID=2816080 RepID=UPI001A8CBE61|nr:XylR N-terminal domain-containing protein [Alicyclobacillus suci]
MKGCVTRVRSDDLTLDQIYRNMHELDASDAEYHRIVTIPTVALGTLRKELISTLGAKRAKGLLLRYGWHCGVADGLKMQSLAWDDPREMVAAGPRMHTLHGYLESRLVVNEVDFIHQVLHVEGHWHNSYEAQGHLNVIGKSDQPVCWTMVGYASGYLSTILGKKVIAKETKCLAMGDDECYCVCRTIDEWNGEVDSELTYYEDYSVVEELDHAFAKLTIERNNLNKAYQIQQNLMKELLREHHLSSIANTFYDMTQLPIYIGDPNMEVLAASGLSTKQQVAIRDAFHIHQKRQHRTQVSIDSVTGAFEIRVGDGVCLLTPLYANRKVIGYCSIFFERVMPQEVDKLILEQVATTCSLYLLNERSRFVTEQRIRGDFLNDILSKRLTEEEIGTRAYYLDFQLIPPYFVVGIHPVFENMAPDEEFQFFDDVIKNVSTFLQDNHINALTGRKADNIVVLVSETEQLATEMQKREFCERLLKRCRMRTWPSALRVGVSSTAHAIQEVQELYEECLSALKVSNADDNIQFFDLLGVEGILFQNLHATEKFVDRLLGDLIAVDKDKNMELMKTLFYYLNHGCNVYRTARAMNFSISGLRYRLQRIQEILKCDINKPYVGNQLYCALLSMISLGKLDVCIVSDEL